MLNYEYGNPPFGFSNFFQFMGVEPFSVGQPLSGGCCCPKMMNPIANCSTRFNDPAISTRRDTVWQNRRPKPEILI